MGLLDDEIESVKRSWKSIRGLGKTFGNNPANREFMDAAFGLGGIAPGVGVPSSMAEYGYRLGQGDYLGAGLAGLGVIPGMALVTKGAKPMAGLLEDIVRGVQKAPKQKALDTIKSGVVDALDRTKTVAEGRGPQSGPFARVAAGDTPLGRNAKARFTLRDKSVASGGGLAAPDFIELHDTPEARRLFASKGGAAKSSIGPEGAQVDIYGNPSDYKGSRLFVSEDGGVGFAIKPDGDIVSVFKSPGGGGEGANVGSVATLLATQEGGRKLDAFDVFLPSKIYGPAGYEHRAGAKFNPDFAPEGWPENLGTPNVSAMAFTPGEARPYPVNAGNTGEYVPGLLGKDGYMDALSNRDKSGIWTPELTPGVSSRLHIASSMPEYTGRTTVNSPARKMFPDIYKDPRVLIEEAAERVAPENPDMLKHFGVSRQDIDDLTRANQAQMARDQVDIPVYSPTSRASAGEYMQQIMGDRNTGRLQDLLSLAAADPRLAGSYGWYWMKPLYDKYVGLLGEELGAKEFDDFMQLGSALSTRSSPASEIRRASLANEFSHARENGLADFYMAQGDSLPPGYGSLAHSSAHRSLLSRFDKTGKFFDEASMMDAPKTPNYYYSKEAGTPLGGNIKWPTSDAHNVRLSGLSDARPAMNGADASISKEEAGFFRDYWRNKVALPLGMEGSPAQALAWNAGSQATGVQGNIGKPYLELVTDAVGRQARHTGRSFEDTLYDFMLGKGRLRQVAPAAGAAGIYGLLQGDDDQGI